MNTKNDTYWVFTERNEWEGETWRFYVKLADGEVKRIQGAIEGLSYYSLRDAKLTEEDVDALVRESECGYMYFHNKCSGITLPGVIDMENDDPFYKGECFEVAR